MTSYSPAFDQLNLRRNDHLAIEPARSLAQRSNNVLSVRAYVVRLVCPEVAFEVALRLC